MTANYHVEIEQIQSALGDRIYVRTRTFPDGIVVTDTLLTTGSEEPKLEIAPEWKDERGRVWA
jgi:hypothetical protein